MTIAVPADLAAAIEADERVPLVRVVVDWDADGFGPAGSIDDLSDGLGTVSVDRSLITDLPDAVRLVEGTSSAMGAIELTAGDATDESMHPARYFTRGSDSVLGSRERINRPATVDIGFLTASGPQYVRRLTGLTRKLTTASRGRTAALTLLDNRGRLRNTVQLVPVSGDEAGADGTWIIMQALAANGIGAGPLPHPTGLLLWMPCYGSISPLRPDRDPFWQVQYIVPNTPTTLARPEFRPGPFVLAAAPRYTTIDDYAEVSVYSGPPVAADWSGLSVRVELWALGETSPTGTPPGGTSRLSIVYTSHTLLGVAAFVSVGIDVDGHLWMRTYDNTFTIAHAFVSAAVIPSDGGWHALGWHLDFTAATVTFRLDGQSETQSTSAVVIANEVPVGLVDEIKILSVTPFSDLLIHDVTSDTPWLADTVVIGAVIDRSLIALAASYEPDPREAWELITEVAAAEQAVAGFDEFGIFRYRTRGRLVDLPGQTVQRVLTTSDGSLLDAQIDDGIDQVRNVIQVGYSPVTVTTAGFNAIFIYREETERVAPPGVISEFPISFDNPALDVDAELAFWSLSEVVALGGGGVADIPGSYFVVTTHADFSDDLGVADDYSALIVGLITDITTSGATLTITNRSTQSMYITGMGITGTAATIGTRVVVEARAADSVALYGAQPLQITLSQWVQTADVARSLAGALLGDLRDPHTTVTGLRVVGDPRRQLGDRVQLTDPDGTQLSGEFWLTQISDQVGSDGDYTQTISAREATTVMRWGIGRWSVNTWG